MGPVIHDAVTLRHFAAVARMDVLEACHGHRPEPRWTEAVRAEIKSAERSCESHLAPTSWLRSGSARPQPGGPTSRRLDLGPTP